MQMLDLSALSDSEFAQSTEAAVKTTGLLSKKLNGRTRACNSSSVNVGVHLFSSVSTYSTRYCVRKSVTSNRASFINSRKLKREPEGNKNSSTSSSVSRFKLSGNRWVDSGFRIHADCLNTAIG